MERKNNKIELVFTYALVMLFSVGVVGHTMFFPKNIMLNLTPYVLLLSSIILIYFLLKENKKENFIWLTAILLITLVIEIIGVKTGKIFGSYYYGEVLGIKLFEVPLIIGVNWVMILTGAIVLSNYLRINKYYKTLAVGILALLFDFILEPIAVKLGYWYWSGNTIPLQNYAAWFLIAFLSSLMYSLLKAEIRVNLLAKYYIIQFVFFLLLNLFL